MLDVIQIPVLDDNYLYLIHDDASGDTAIVDPAVKEPVLEKCAEMGWALTHIINTHHHWDHTGANKALKAETDCEIIGFEGDKDRIPGIDRCVQEGDTIALGDHTAHVIEIPGHTTGHIAYYFAGSKMAFVGDTIFAMGCGRMFEGTPIQFWDSINKLMKLPDDTTIYCAHEYTMSNGKFALSIDPDNIALQNRMTEVQKLRAQGLPTVPFTLAIEKETNPFMRPTSTAIQNNIGMTGRETHEVFGKIRALKDNF